MWSYDPDMGGSCRAGNGVLFRGRQLVQATWQGQEVRGLFPPETSFMMEKGKNGGSDFCRP